MRELAVLRDRLEPELLDEVIWWGYRRPSKRSTSDLRPALE